jgi:hypothetical protein
VVLGGRTCNKNTECSQRWTHAQYICAALFSLVGKALGDTEIESFPIKTPMTKTELFPRTLAANPISMPLIVLQDFNAVTSRENIEPKITLSLFLWHTLYWHSENINQTTRAPESPCYWGYCLFIVHSKSSSLLPTTALFFFLFLAPFI